MKLGLDRFLRKCILVSQGLKVAPWAQDNLSRGNLGAVEALKQLFPQSGRLQLIVADLGDSRAVSMIAPWLGFSTV